MYDIPTDLHYSQDHLWVRADPDRGVVRVGITDFAQQSLGDVVTVTLPEPGETLAAGEACGEIESTKSISDLIAPVAGTVRTLNDGLENTPDLVNTDPYGEGWMFDVEVPPSGLAEELNALMDAATYQALVSQ